MVSKNNIAFEENLGQTITVFWFCKITLSQRKMSRPDKWYRVVEMFKVLFSGQKIEQIYIWPADFQYSSYINYIHFVGSFSRNLDPRLKFRLNFQPILDTVRS